MVLINTESCRYWTWSKESLLQWQNNISRQVGRCSCIVGSKTIQCVLPNSYCNCLREGKKHANKRKLVTTLQTTHAHSFQLSYKGRKRSPSTTSDWTTTNINLKLSINMDSSTKAESGRQKGVLPLPATGRVSPTMPSPLCLHFCPPAYGYTQFDSV